MNRDDAIKAVAEHLRSTYGASVVAWMDGARSLADAGLLAIDPEPEPEPLPVGTHKRDPKTGHEAIRTDDEYANAPWFVYKGRSGQLSWLTDGDVAEWEVIADAPVTNDMRVVQDGPDAQDVVSGAPKATIDAASLASVILRAMLDWSVSLGSTNPAEAERIRTGHRDVMAAAIRAWVDKHGHRPPLPEGHVTLDLRDISQDNIDHWATIPDEPHAPGWRRVASRVGRAELTRRRGERS